MRRARPGGCRRHSRARTHACPRCAPADRPLLRDRGRRRGGTRPRPLPEDPVVVLVPHWGAVPDLLAPGTLQMGIRARPAEPRAIRRVGVAQRLLEEWVLPGTWFRTMSTSTRMPSRCAAATRRLKSSLVPYSGLTR